MSVTELSGKPADPDCLHCVLAPIIDQFRQEHPDKPDGQLVGELAQILGDVIGSMAFTSGHSGCVTNIVTGAARETLRSAIEMVETLKRRRA